MPSYQATPFREPIKLAIAGQPTYLFGSYNDRTSPTFGYVISNSAVGTTGTVTFNTTQGNVPLVGDKITVRGTTNSAGVFNTTNATILTVVADFSTGVVTVTYAISSTAQVTLSDAGQVEIPQSEIGEAIIAGASIPVAVSFAPGNTNQDRAITAVVSFPTLPVAATVVLQQAVQDIDSEYATINTVVVVAGSVITSGGQITVDPVLGRFFRFLVSGLTPGAGTIVGKILT